MVVLFYTGYNLPIQLDNRKFLLPYVVPMETSHDHRTRGVSKQQVWYNR